MSQPLGLRQAIPNFPCSCQRLLCSFLMYVVVSVVASHALAEVRTVTAQGEYRMGDRDTKEDAIRLATESAKRNALEQVATYLESVTVVEGTDITKDEIRTYTAGLVLVLDQKTHTILDADTVVVGVDLVAQIDTEEVKQAIAALRDNEDARVQLAALKQENEQLQQDLDAANRALTNASTADQAQQAAQQRQDILNRVQSNALVSQAWTDWVLVSPIVASDPWVGLSQTYALLNVAGSFYPANPHIAAAQQIITARRPPTAPQPPIPPGPGTTTSRMPSYELIPPPGGQGRARMLNEMTYKTPVAPSTAGSPPGWQQVTDGHLPPTIHQIHPPVLPQVPRVPFQMAPGGFSGGGHYSAGGGHAGGGRNGRGR